MPIFRPISSIRKLSTYIGKPLSEIDPSEIAAVREKLKAFQPAHPQVSIVFICYNEEDYLYPAMASIAETQVPWDTEILVVNNNSTDASQKILDSLGVRSLMEKEAGWSAARNAGLKAARGEILLTADADNMYPPGWAEHMAAPLLENHDVVATCSLYCFYTEDDRYPALLELYQQLRLVNSRLRHPKRPHLNCLGGSMGYRRALGLEVGGYRADGRGEDGEFAFRLARHGKIVFRTSRRAFSYSNLRTVFKDGSIGSAMWVRLVKNARRLTEYLSTQKE